MEQSVHCERKIVHSTVVSLLMMRAQQQPCRVAYRFVPERGGAREVTYSELDQRARAIACMLTDLGILGQPAALLYPPGLDYIAAFFGCLYAGVIAVPAGPPDPLKLDCSLPRLAAVVGDAMPSAVLTTTAMSTALRSLPGAAPEISRLSVIVTDAVPAEYSHAWEPAPVGAESIALLQYTSGSTSAPKGVVLTHRNLMSNSALISRLFGHSVQSRGVSWLPPYHDMGLIGGVIQPLYGGFPVTLMAPADFLRRPLSWLQEISRTRATTSGGPNFAYDLCVRKTTAEERLQLDLSSWQVAFNGSEPIRAETMENFARAFAPTGFRREALHPCYGLAEATLIVTGGISWSRRGLKSLDTGGRRNGTAIPGATGTRSPGLVSCGLAPGQRQVIIVDPDTRVECPAGQVGEIWISGRGVAQSYWRRPEETRETFRARLAGTGEGPFLRSGDLGFMLGRELFVTGRIKDLIIVRGRNHHPQDIELTPDRASLLSVPAWERQNLLRDYLSGLVASACGIDRAEAAAEVPLLALGIDSYAAISIQYSIQADLGAHVTASDLTRAASITDLAGRLDEQIGRAAPAPRIEVPAPASPPGLTVAEKSHARLYCWVGGSRVSALGAL
jgi:acyl-CoA synthetase (AMP-forming)/AMP-acid ligase II